MYVEAYLSVFGAPDGSLDQYIKTKINHGDDTMVGVRLFSTANGWCKESYGTGRKQYAPTAALLLLLGAPVAPTIHSWLSTPKSPTVVLLFLGAFSQTGGPNGFCLILLVFFSFFFFEKCTAVHYI